MLRRIDVAVIHDLLEARGKQAILSFDHEPPIDRKIVEVASAYMADEDCAVGFIFSGWTQAALPHRALARPEDIWQIRSGAVTLLVEPGRRPNPIESEPPTAVGVPYGSRARLIMLYLQTEALKTNSREIELGKSLRSWIKRMGIPQGGKSIKDVREQADRISRCRLTFHAAAGQDRAGLINQNIMDSAMFLEEEDAGRTGLFLEKAKLSESFFNELKKHPVPIEESAIRALSNNSVALDVYCWLAYRLHVLPKAKHVTWAAMKAQFGTGYAQDKVFRANFIPNLNLAMAVYRDAKVEVSSTGVTLYPSRSPIRPLGQQRSG